MNEREMDNFQEKLNSNELVNSELTRNFTKVNAELDNPALVKYVVEKLYSLDKEGLKVISLIGGAASGKTTLAASIKQELAQSGIQADVISTDDFVIGDRDYRRQNLEGKDPLAKYDFKYMNELIERIKNNNSNETIGVPTYNEQTGVAIAAGEDNYKHQIGKVDVLIVEGDFDQVSQSDLDIYMHVSDEIRLQNRVGRDTKTRSETDHQKVIDNFNLRQKLQHFPHTVPSVQKANIILEASLNGNEYSYSVHERNN